MIDNATSYLAGIFVLIMAIGIWLLTGWMTGIYYTQKRWLKVTWFAIPEKLGYMLLGWVTIWSAGGIIEAIQHTGGGMVTASEGGGQGYNSGGESVGSPVWADEWEYKRKTGGEYSMFFWLAIYAWSVIVKLESDEKLKKRI